MTHFALHLILAGLVPEATPVLRHEAYCFVRRMEKDEGNAADGRFSAACCPLDIQFHEPGPGGNSPFVPAEHLVIQFLHLRELDRIYRNSR